MESANDFHHKFDSSAFVNDPDFALETFNFEELCDNKSECSERCLHEEDGLDASHSAKKQRALLHCPFATKDIPLVIQNNTFRSNDDTARLLRAIGGPTAIHRLTAAFYAKFFANAHLAVFVADPTAPHAQRLGNWIVEKMGGGTVWTEGIFQLAYLFNVFILYSSTLFI
jgi:hypothetical protein